MNLAIFGGSGVIGRALLPALAQRGHRIRAMRHNAPLPVDDVETVHGSITDPEAVAATIRGAEVVLQLTKGGSGVEQAVETSVRGTINVLDAVCKATGITQYLLTSSDAATGIGAHPYPEPISHETPPCSYGDYYSLGKVLEETIVADYHRNVGVPYTVARLSWVQREDMVLRHFIAGYNRERPTAGPSSSGYSAEQTARLESGAQFVVLPCDGAGQPLARTLVQLEDATSALLAMVGCPEAVGHRFHISGPGFRYDEPCRYLGEKLGLPVERVSVPGEYPFDIDVSHTTKQLGWAPKYDVFAMIDAALAWREQ